MATTIHDERGRAGELSSASNRRFRRQPGWVVAGLVLMLSVYGSPGFAGQGPVTEFTLVVQEKTIEILGDPKKTATVWAYALEGREATVPGPEIRVKVGDTVRVHFKNTHSRPHTVHFHGVHPFNMDGNGQRALGKEQLQLPGEEYTYEFVARDPGYYLYHCHFNTAVHIDHGMYGLFIVEDPAWPRVDREIITFWDEWDLDGDGEDDAHTINSQSAPDYEPLKASVGERVRLVLANMGWELHTPHLHGHTWQVVDGSDLRTILSKDPNGVISLAPAQIKVVEFTPAYAGTWLFHCHVVPHVADDGKYPRGMLTVVSVEPREAQVKDQGEPDAMAAMADDLSKAPPESEEKSKADSAQLALLAGNADRGFDLYGANCKACHAANAQGEYGPKLAGNPILEQPERYWNTVLNGRGANMPAWKDNLSGQDLADILAWLKTLN